MRTSLVAGQGLMLGLAAALPEVLEIRATSSVTPTAVQTAAPFVYAACAVEPFYNGLQVRALHGGSTYRSGMTVEMCAAYCSEYKYFGVEYSQECYCGNIIHNGTTLDTQGGCNMECPGNTAQQCGGSGRMNFYQQSTVSTALSLPTSYSVATNNAVVDGWNYLTCVVEPLQLGINARALTGAIFYSGSMTIGYCASQCAGYTYFGVEYGQGTPPLHTDR